jgi:hypothetical protein
MAFWAGPPPIKNAELRISVFDHNISIMPKNWPETYHGKSLVFYEPHKQGGHFRESIVLDACYEVTDNDLFSTAALDNPEALVQDMREFAAEHVDLFSAPSRD